MGVADGKPLRLKRERVEEKLLLSQSVVDLLVDTPIPHLDQLYTYSIPESIEQQIVDGLVPMNFCILIQSWKENRQ